MENILIDDGSDFILKHEKIIMGIIWKKFYSFTVNRDQFDDLMQEGRIALIKARDTYNPKYSSFNTYASKCIYNRLIDYIDDYYSFKTISLNEFMDSNNNTYEDVFATEKDLNSIDSIYKDIIDFINSKDIITKNIFSYTLKGYTQREISKILNLDKMIVNKKILVLRNEISKEFNIKINNKKTNGRIIATEMDGKFIAEFDDLKQASNELGIDISNIRKIAQGLRHSAKSKVLNKKLTFEWG